MKRLFDYLMSALGIMLLSPLFGVVGLRWCDHGFAGISFAKCGRDGAARHLRS